MGRAENISRVTASQSSFGDENSEARGDVSRDRLWHESRDQRETVAGYGIAKSCLEQ